MHESFLKTLAIIPKGVILFENTSQNKIQFLNNDAMDILKES